MTRTVFLGAALVALAGCSTHSPEAVQPEACLEVERLEQQAILARSAATSAVGQAGMIRTRSTGPMTTEERRQHEIETRQLTGHSEQRAAENSGRASRLTSEARALAAELRAQGIRCDL